MKNTQYKLDKELLCQLYKIIAPSREEFAMQNFLMDYLMGMGKDIYFEMDEIGNILVTKGVTEIYPCICAHMDEVHDAMEVCGRQLIEADGKISGFSLATNRQCGIGADDKNGIYIALEALRNLPAVKVFFTVNEECGTDGSSGVDLSFFDDCRYVLSADRRNGGDLINHAGGMELCSPEFLRALKKLRKKYHYKPAQGALADVVILKDRGLDISCVNISCGYYNPHTSQEYTVLSALENCLNFVMEICQNVTDVYPHVWAEIDSDEEEEYYNQKMWGDPFDSNEDIYGKEYHEMAWPLGE